MARRRGNPPPAPCCPCGVIGGKVVDASALAALVRGRLAAVAWFAAAKTTGLTLYLPALAVAEVRAVRPDAGSEIAEALGHPSVVLGELDAVGAREQVARADR